MLFCSKLDLHQQLNYNYYQLNNIIAKSNNKMSTHNMKWGQIQSTIMCNAGLHISFQVAGVL